MCAWTWSIRDIRITYKSPLLGFLEGCEWCWVIKIKVIDRRDSKLEREKKTLNSMFTKCENVFDWKIMLVISRVRNSSHCCCCLVRNFICNHHSRVSIWRHIWLNPSLRPQKKGNYKKSKNKKMENGKSISFQLLRKMFTSCCKKHSPSSLSLLVASLPVSSACVYKHCLVFMGLELRQLKLIKSYACKYISLYFV